MWVCPLDPPKSLMEVLPSLAVEDISIQWLVSLKRRWYTMWINIFNIMAGAVLGYDVLYKNYMYRQRLTQIDEWPLLTALDIVMYGYCMCERAAASISSWLPSQLPYSENKSDTVLTAAAIRLIHMRCFERLAMSQERLRHLSPSTFSIVTIVTMPPTPACTPSKQPHHYHQSPSTRHLKSYNKLFSSFVFSGKLNHNPMTCGKQWN